MKTLSLFKLHAVVALILTMTGFSAVAQTAGQQFVVGTPDRESTLLSMCSAAQAAELAAKDKLVQACSETGLGSEINKAHGKGGCIGLARTCQEDLADAGADAELNSDFSSALAGIAGTFGISGAQGSSSTSEYDRIAARCPVAKGTSVKEDLRTAKKDLDDIEKDLKDLKKEILEKQEQTQKDLAEVEEQITEMKDEKVKQDADMETALTEAQQQSANNIASMTDQLRELNTSILNAEAGKAQALIDKTKSIAGMTDRLMSISCNEEVNASLKGKFNKNLGTIKSFGKQSATKQELYNRCMQKLAAERQEIITKHNTAVARLDDEISKSRQRMEQFQTDLQKANEAAAQLVTQHSSKKSAAETKFQETLARLNKRLVEINNNALQYQQTSALELQQLQSKLTQKTSEVTLLQAQKRDNTYTVKDVVSFYSDYENKVSATSLVPNCKSVGQPPAGAAPTTTPPTGTGTAR